jgi:hypothetical protein
MGGYGSGRRGGKHVAENCRSLDANKMHRAGCLRGGYAGGWEWTRDGQSVASIRFASTSERLTLDYRYRINGGDWQDVTQPVPINWEPCRYGGQRAYFLCPGVVGGRYCGRRVVKLYMGNKYFLCRHCYRLAYRSQNLADHDRGLHKANKRRMALGGEPGTCAVIRKPKGMWWRTFARHVGEIESAEDRANVAFMARFVGKLPPDELAMYFD